MTLPNQLQKSFEDIKACELIIKRTFTKDSIQTFVNILNRSIPTPMSPTVYSVYRFNRSKYMVDKPRFVSDIKFFPPYDALILWTDYQDILSFFKLEGKLFLGWDKKSNRYRAFAIEEQLPIKILRRGETLTNNTEQMIHSRPPLVPTHSPPPLLTNVEDDQMDRLYAHMQSRLSALQKQIANERK